MGKIPVRTSQPLPVNEPDEVRVAADEHLLSDDEYEKYPNRIDYGHEKLNEIFQVMLGPIPETNSPDTIRGCEAILSAMVIGAWTAFETLAGDLWVAALNTSPRRLARLSGDKKRIIRLAKTGTEKAERLQGMLESRRTQDGEGKIVHLSDVQELSKGTYDLSGKMGNLLRNSFKFTTLTGIREAYAVAFDEHSQAIDDALKDGSLDVLCLVRNLIVHRAGRADSTYCKEASSVPGARVLPKVSLWYWTAVWCRGC